MFEQTFIDGPAKTNKGWAVTLSFALESLGVGLMIAIPLIWTDVLPKALQVSMLNAPALPPPPPAQPPQPVQKSVRVAPRRFDGQALQAPQRIPTQVAVIVDDLTPPLHAGDTVGGFDVAGVLGEIGVPGPSIGQTPLPLSPPPPAVNGPPKREQGPYRQSSGVQAARCVNCSKPQYPSIAKQARIQGAVVLQAIIAKDGTVQRLVVVSSASPLLTSAAMDAVKKWVYSPTILDSEPVEVITEITVNFTLQ